MAKAGKRFVTGFYDEYKVIGNIHENLELLEDS